jgi:molybdenum storage protein
MTNIDENVLLTALGKQLMMGSLTDVEVMQATEETPNYPILPWVNVVKIGGQSIIDRGREAVYPLVEEILANLKLHKMILGTGAGTRARHIYSLAIDLGLPTGVLTVLGTAVAWQNAQMLHYLLARHGIPFVEPEGFGTLPHYLMERNAVVCQGMPPYKLWEENPTTGRIPPQRTDTGCFLIAEVFGARKMIYVKDEDGLYTADPKKGPSCEHIPRIGLRDLLALDLNDLIVERAVLELMLHARHIHEIQFVNGLKPGQLTSALNGERVGTTIYRAESPQGDQR